MRLLMLSAVVSVGLGSPDLPHAHVAHHGSPYPAGPPHHLSHSPHPYHPTTPYPPPPYGHSTPVYGHSSPVYGPTTPAYGHSTPAYGYSTPAPYHKPGYSKHQVYPAKIPKYGEYESPKHCGYEKAPTCSHNTTKQWCLEDYEYPEYEIKGALEYHKKAVLDLYADVADLNTANSVVRPNTLDEETYLCPSDTSYVRPLRAVNTDGKWRLIVNNIKVDYEKFTQTTRLEECVQYGKPCPLVPHCYDSSCLQKSVYHRFLVYDSCDKHFPFAIESFKLPASCACHLGAYYITH